MQRMLVISVTEEGAPEPTPSPTLSPTLTPTEAPTLPEDCAGVSGGTWTMHKCDQLVPG